MMKKSSGRSDWASSGRPVGGVLPDPLRDLPGMSATSSSSHRRCCLVFIEVLLVTLIIHKVLNLRENGTYGEAQHGHRFLQRGGDPTVGELAACDPGAERSAGADRRGMDEDAFIHAKRTLRDYEFLIDSQRDLAAMRNADRPARISMRLRKIRISSNDTFTRLIRIPPDGELAARPTSGATGADCPTSPSI